MGFFLFTVAAIAYTGVGYCYTHGKVKLYHRILNKERNEFYGCVDATKKELKFWEKAMCQLFWPRNEAYIPDKYTDTADSTRERIIYSDPFRSHSPSWKELSYMLGSILFWPVSLTIMALPNLIILPNMLIATLANTKGQYPFKIRREESLAKATVDKLSALPPVSRYISEIDNRVTELTGYRDRLNRSDDIYNKLYNEISAVYSEIELIVKGYKVYSSMYEKYPTESKIYDIASANLDRLGNYKSQVQTKKGDLLSFINEIIDMLGKERKSVEAEKAQEERNLQAIKVLSNLDRRALDIDLQAKAYFNDRVLDILNILDMVTDNAHNQTLVHDALEQIKMENQHLNLVSLDDGVHFNEIEIRTLSYLNEVDTKISEARKRLGLKTDGYKLLAI